jgi:hypothetical protein
MASESHWKWLAISDQTVSRANRDLHVSMFDSGQSPGLEACGAARMERFNWAWFVFSHFGHGLPGNQRFAAQAGVLGGGAALSTPALVERETGFPIA